MQPITLADVINATYVLAISRTYHPVNMQKGNACPVCRNFEQELVDIIIRFAANNPTKPY